MLTRYLHCRWRVLVQRRWEFPFGSSFSIRWRFMIFITIIRRQVVVWFSWVWISSQSRRQILLLLLLLFRNINSTLGNIKSELMKLTDLFSESRFRSLLFWNTDPAKWRQATPRPLELCLCQYILRTPITQHIQLLRSIMFTSFEPRKVRLREQRSLLFHFFWIFFEFFLQFHLQPHSIKSKCWLVVSARIS